MENLEKEPYFGEFICVLDKSSTSMDYLEGEICVRLLGFRKEQLISSSTLELYTFDILDEDFYAIKSRNGNLYVEGYFDKFKEGESYIELTFRRDESSDSYFYKSYSAEEPKKISIKSLYFHERDSDIFDEVHPAINNLIKQSTNNQSLVYIRHGNEFNLHVYSVGQGMCSLLHNGNEGYLLDAGAGTPVLRGNYQKNIFNNDLMDEIKNLDKVSLILSHLDSDHFRIIRWDGELLKKIEAIYIPSGLLWLDSAQNGIASKVRETNKIIIKSNNMILIGLRTKPANNSNLKNDNELICCLGFSGGNNFLFPGDYTYSKMRNDNNLAIRTVMKYKFEFVVVPHHGDSQSAYSIPSPSSQDSMAFFSAGNHRAWNHPVPESVDEHERKKYNSLMSENYPYISKVKSY